MPAVVYTEQSDDVTDLIHRARAAADHEVALVVNAGTVGLRTPLSVRLLRQVSMNAGKTVSVISGDPYVQELSRRGGLPTYASVPAFERGIQTVRPHGDDAMPVASAAGRMADPAAAAVAPAAAVASPAPRRSILAPAASRWRDRRRPLYFAIAGVVLLGVVLLLVVAPSATVNITLAGQPLSANPTIQGTADATSAGQPDHIVTSVVTSDQKQTFDAKPSGTQPVPGVPAKATIHFTTTVPNGAIFTVNAGNEFDTTDNPPIRFVAAQATNICIGPNGAPPAGCPAGWTPNADAPVQDATGEAKGNVGAGTITKWSPPSEDPCNPGNPSSQQCFGGDITFTNPSPASGGADPTTQTVASQNDVTSWTNQVNQLEQQLTGQVNSDMQSKAGGKVFAKDPGGNGTTIACTATPGVPNANQAWKDTTITVECQGSGSAYSVSDVLTDARADLQSQVPQGNVIDPTSLSCTKPAVTQAATDGTVVLSVSCTGFSEPSIDTQSLRNQLSGKSPGDAKNLIEHQLANVESVSISQSPVPLFWLPFFANRISINTSFVPATTTGGGSTSTPGPSPTGT